MPYFTWLRFSQQILCDDQPLHLARSFSDGHQPRIPVNPFHGIFTAISISAERKNRHWIACDLGRFAVLTARKRLLSIPDIKPFVVQNLGKYERQAWQAAEFGGEKEAAQIADHQSRQ